MPLERRQVILGVAAVIVLGLAVWTFRPASTPVTAAPQTPARARTAKAAAPAPGSGPVAPVKLGSLTASRNEPGNAQRNPFRFQPRIVAPPPRPIERPVTEAPVRPPPPMPTGPPPPPPIPLKFVGIVERASGVKWAVLTDGKSAPMHGKDGDIIDGKYLIVKIGTESIEMTYTDGRGRQVIRLTGQ
ncbi:MAG: hypothetical protein K2Y23_08735 [Cyanobacteria bacterium]|nr:hypothetical protein [Cyanobacteriota bacterium]